MYRGLLSHTLSPPPGKKGSGLASLSRPKTRAVFAQVGVSPTVNPARHMTGEHQVPRPNRRLPVSQTAGTAKRNYRSTGIPSKTYLDPQTYLSPNYLSPNIHLKTLKAHLGAKINLHLTRPAESPSVERHKAKAKILTEGSPADVNTQSNSGTSYLLVSLTFVVCNVDYLGKYFVLSSNPERLPVDTLSNGLLDRRSLLASCQVRARCSGRSLELEAHWPFARTKEKRLKRQSQWKDKQRKHSLYPTPNFSSLVVWYQCERSRLPSKTGTLTSKGLTKNSESKLKHSHFESC